ncbi:hypothetical protein BOX15_Mlig022027g4, partial [Macrostomum lignano]
YWMKQPCWLLLWQLALALLLPLLHASMCAAASGSAAPASASHQVFIFGCTGDLAQRYLWPAFRLVQLERPSLQLHCVTRGSLNADRFLAGAEPELRDWFFEKVKLHQGVRDRAGYERLCSQDPDESPAPDGAISSRRRIFYLSIPPRSYADVARAVQLACPHPAGSPTSNEFVLEKPFGSDAESAESLAAELAEAGVSEAQLHRVDHYLAKPVLASLLQFRQANPHLESLLSSAHVTRVEAAIWESLGVEDRLAFYDSEGVIRDVMQNHLTEMLSLLLMDLPPSEPPPPDWLESEKSRLLAAYCPLLGERHLLAGRYAGFGGSSATPTFAAAGLTVCRSARWQSVPIFASAGKRLAFKASFIRLRFQLATERTEDELLVFVGGDAKATGLARPLIACSSGLRCRPSAGLSVLPSNEAGLSSGEDAAETESLLRFPTDRYAFFSAVSEQESQNSYVAVVRQLLRSSSESPINSCFVGLPSLLASWRLWDPALAAVADLAELDDEDSGLRVYPSKWLPDLIANQRGQLQWPASPKIESPSSKATQTTKALQSTANLIRLDPAVCNGASDCEFLLHRGSPLSLSRQLAFRIASKVKEAFIASTATVYGQKNQFHLALPGGQSAQMLMQFLAALSRDDDTLANAFATTLHIWVTDERCVHDDPGSVTQNESQLNSAVIDRNFLQQLPSAARLPLHHLHFPRLLTADVAGCRAAADAYASEVDNWLNFRSNISALPPSFDFVVLGVGTDGHAASLFSPHDLDKWDRSMPISSAEDQLSQGCEQSARVTNSPKAPFLRISLSSCRIASSSEVAFILVSKAKQAAIDLIAKPRETELKTPIYVHLLRLVGKKRGRLWVDHSLDFNNIV